MSDNMFELCIIGRLFTNKFPTYSRIPLSGFTCSYDKTINSPTMVLKFGFGPPLCVPNLRQ